MSWIMGRRPTSSGSAASCGDGFRDVITFEIHPAHHAGDERMLVRELEQEARFLDGGRRLHENGRADAGLARAAARDAPAGSPGR